MTVVAECEAVRPIDDSREVRRLPTPMSEPPYDDEVDGPGSTHAGTAHPGQGALSLAFALPGGLPAVPALRLLPNPPEAAPAAAVGAPERTARLALPDPHVFAGRLVQAVLEVAVGLRPAAQLARWTNTAVYTEMNDRVRGVARTGAVGRRSNSAGRVRSVHVSEPCDGVIEVCATVQREGRATAIAMRLDGVDGRWQCTALRFG